MTFERARAVMVDNQLRPANITDRQLLSAMGKVPREKFVTQERSAIAYTDTDHPMGKGGRQLANPVAFAKLVQLAEITPQDFVLDAGCGLGYSTAVLADLAGSVVGLDEEAALVDAANTNLADLEIGNATAVAANITEGMPSEAPFDVIVIEGAVDEVPSALFDQLRDGGRLVVMLNDGATPTAYKYVKSGDDITARAEFDAAIPQLLVQQVRPQFTL